MSTSTDKDAGTDADIAIDIHVYMQRTISKEALGEEPSNTADRFDVPRSSLF